jgi:hypothetical protein
MQRGPILVRVIHAVRMRCGTHAHRALQRNADVLARDLIPNTVPENSADQTIFQFLNYGNS